MEIRVSLFSRSAQRVCVTDCIFCLAGVVDRVHRLAETAVDAEIASSLVDKKAITVLCYDILDKENRPDDLFFLSREVSLN